ncbi:ribosomal protein S7 [Auriscalpium vulgare]|uniref:Ribosomal protein S7 n=1 Tax=Auriscalpium vulgare TaxID=40419 RepID=A0ACB8RHV0_9AGAM|nr:ribosomal protein S7 [Auriscalpium vulgare]
MLSPIRHAARRSILALSRPMATATASTSSAAPTGAIETMLPGFASAPPKPTLLRAAPGQPILLDIPPVEDPLLQYLANKIQKHGKRKQAARIVSRTLLWLHTLTRAPPLPIVREAIFAASPAVRSLNHRHGAKTVARPIALGEKQRTRYAVDWILKTVKEKKNGQTLEERLARELIAVLNGDSGVLKKKEEAHRFAMVNRGNAEART